MLRRLQLNIKKKKNPFQIFLRWYQNGNVQCLIKMTDVQHGETECQYHYGCSMSVKTAAEPTTSEFLLIQNWKFTKLENFIS